MAESKSKFDDGQALKIARKIGFTERWEGVSPWGTKPSTRFRYFVDDERFLLVAGADQGPDVALALAYGLSYRGDRPLVLALPRDHCEATMQRVPWLRQDAAPEIWLHGRSIREVPHPRTRPEAVKRLSRPRKRKSPEKELNAATRPKHLGKESAPLFDLVEWATQHPLLDPAHRRGERAWHCMGQRVLSMAATKGGVQRVTAGIHYSGDKAPQPFPRAPATALTPADVEHIRTLVGAAVDERLGQRDTRNDQISRPDEHWLQAVIRRNPSLVGVEQPALRELPAWRPNDAPTLWSRGYIDLIGLDGHGDIRIVETKVSSNDDALLVLQGLDYFVWCCAYEDVLHARLGAPKAAEFEIHYVIGADTKTNQPHVSPFSDALVDALAPDVRWRSQVVRDWYDPDTAAAERPQDNTLVKPTAEMAPPGSLLPR